MYQLIQKTTSIRHLPTNTIFPMPPMESFGHDYQAWLDAGNTPDPAPVDPQPTQRELDQRRYKRRAEVQSDLLAYMAADNMSRVRSGAWSVADLTALMADPDISGVLAWMQTLSYEKAAELIAAATHPLMTPAIKADWISKLQASFYLEP